MTAEALRMIGGLLREANALTALGNTVTSSYLRLVPGHEAPTKICWGRYDRSSLIRIPLDFATEERLDQTMNPGETAALPDMESQATVEYRGPDGSAFSLLLLAAIAQCTQHGLSDEDSLSRARKLERSTTGTSDSAFDVLPSSAGEASRRLLDRRMFFEDLGLPPIWIHLVSKKLLLEDDGDLPGKLETLSAEDRAVELRRILHKDLHKH